MDRPPVIDLRELGAHGNGIGALRDACTVWGAFQVVGHGIPEASSNEFLRQARAFFALGPSEKRGVYRTATNPFGFYDQELTKRRPDWKQVFDCASEKAGGSRARVQPDDQNQWPEAMPSFRSAVLSHVDACERVSFELLRALCESLGLARDTLDPFFTSGHTSFLRLNFYPTCDEPAPEDAPLLPEKGRLGVHHHTDAGAFTILAQDDVDSLQVQRDGRWHLIERAPGALIVNLADMLQVWTNDRYRSPLHRVLARRDRDRYSAPYFFNPSYLADCQPLEALCGDEPPRYRPVNWGEFRRRRTDGDYADYGEEVQIEQYRTQHPTVAEVSASDPGASPRSRTVRSS